MREQPRLQTPWLQRRLTALLLTLLITIAGIIISWHQTPDAFATAPVSMLYGSASDAPDSELQAIVNDVVSDVRGTWGVAIKKLDTGQFAVVNGDRQQVSASLYKLWVLAELYHQVSLGDINLDDSATVSYDDAYYDASLGDVRLSAGNDVTFRGAAKLMITVSDNTAAALLVRNLGADNINRFMQQNELNDSVLDWSGSGDNLTTPLDVMRELELIATSKMVDADSSEEMLNLLLDQQINNRLPVGLPAEARIAHKTGDLSSLLHDAGIVYGPRGPFIIVAMASDLYSLDEVWEKMPELARRVYDYFNTNPSSPARYFPETRQTVGHDFLKFWNDYGGLETFGYPIAPEHMGGNLLVQQFERGRFELHPEMAGAGGPVPTVGLGLLGQERAAQLKLSWAAGPNDGTGIYFDGTGQQLTGDFLNYWRDHGGERIFGWPISPAADMVNPSDGSTVLTQWFQRARMEYHPELPVGRRIVLGALGSELATSDR
ncbi:MAG: serine hydrolase [Chloroflexota bacterium]